MDQNNMHDHQEPDNDIEGNEPLPYQAAVIGWGIAAVALSIFSITFNNSYMVLSAGFFTKFFAVIVGSVLGLIGALVGDSLRRFTRPTAFFTTGGFFSLMFIKLFWLAGPQLIGLFIGAMFGVSLVLS
jgi:uncharacterized membrane protein YvlD (DUF360 family)